MKKLFIIILLLTLTGCGADKCNLKFMSNMTDNYNNDASKCETVSYVNKEKNMEVFTTPSEDKKSFTAKIDYNDNLLEHSFMEVKLTNIKISTHKNINFLELYNTNGYVDLVVFDAFGNVRYEINNSSIPVINGDNFTVVEYLLRLDKFNSDYVCDNYNVERVAYREKTYNIISSELVETKEIKVKDICK